MTLASTSLVLALCWIPVSCGQFGGGGTGVSSVSGISSAGSTRCSSISHAFQGGWKPATTAPHDGTTVEMMETFGISPWYGVFKWTRDIPTQMYEWDSAGKQVDKGMQMTKLDKPTWVSVDRPGHGVSEDECLFWRPYKASGKYTDPTGGAQWGVAYWCAAAHREYDAKKDRCK